MITNKTFDEIQIGDTARMQRTLTKQEIDLFGLLSGDMNPTHFSDEYARMLLERHKLVGHSMWGGALVSSLLGNELPGPGTVYQSQNFEFHNVVELGDILTITVTAKSKDATDGSVLFDCRVVNQREQEIITGVAKVKAPAKKPADLGSPYATMQLHRKTAFKRLIDHVKDWERIPTAVCHPCSKEALEGPINAAKTNLIDPILVGPETKIRALAESLNLEISPYRLVDALHSHDAAAKAVALCRSGEAEALMKGSLHTDELMGAVVPSATGLRTERRISHVFAMDVPTYPRPLFITDAAINIYPTLEDKVDILKNAIQLAHALNIPQPKVAILSAVETVNPKIPATIEAAALCKMADRGQIEGAIIDGPLAFDNAISKEAALIKGIHSPVAGEADILLAPDLEAGNMLAKQLAYLGRADSAGIVLGARVPIILTSRADSAEARLASCAVAVAFAYWQRSH
ncbi:bifunctional enoyl-CoA hydratase/phosphate acetyltransferase [Desulfomonile tiedjei]|uniref:Phosphotransacetylase n=1 Tax=Desulfomonile tiedjei (strain ATCC 49306 / DSM 6799 / DCB-1) TaxID=706587 RepID=I4CE10_DESTA|nr:bifunctional enoyl-CoA hydratase/phosphate acetyltransferase [Desulfomonile tiedjei]AFM27801.1 phosphotransacetylase [Desulfomonile tiedjei DSM 6799]